MTPGVEGQVVQHLLGYEASVAHRVRTSACLGLLVIRQLDQRLLYEFLHWVLALLALDTALQEGDQVVHRLQRARRLDQRRRSCVVAGLLVR